MSEALKCDSLQENNPWQATPHPAPLQGVQLCIAEEEGCIQSATTTGLGSLGFSDLSLLVHAPSSHSIIERSQDPSQDAWRITIATGSWQPQWA